MSTKPAAGQIGSSQGGVMGQSAFAALVVSAGLLLPAVGRSAEISLLPGDTPIIAVLGDLLHGDERKFIDVALPHPNAVVGLRSPGGNLQAGIEIGRAIRLKGYSTIVLDDTTCASACALAWLGGRKRIMGSRSRIGFHAAYVDKDGTQSVTGSGNAVVGAYLNQLGLSTPAIIYLTSAAPDGMNWLTPAQARSSGLEVEVLEDKSEPQRVRPPAPPIPPSPMASGIDWTAQGEWVQAASRPSLSEAIEVASAIRVKNSNTAVFQYRNGWFGVVVGPFSPDKGAIALAAMLRAGEVPSDSLVTRGGNFSTLAWGDPKPRQLPGSPPPTAGLLTQEQLPTFAAQVAVRPTPIEAREAWTELTALHPNELGNRPARLTMAEVNGRTVYRVRVGPMTEGEATALCNRLRARSGSCFVARNN